jgi:hypothetical protein
LIQTERDGYLEDPKYIEDLPEDHQLKRNENVFPFSMSTAAFEVLQFLRMFLAPSGISDVGGDDYQFVLSQHKRDVSFCSPNCYFSNQLVGRGDTLAWAATGHHAAAVTARNERTVGGTKDCGGVNRAPTLPSSSEAPQQRLKQLGSTLLNVIRGLLRAN